jgi:hydrogenase expression/formation protein HypD
MKYVDEFRNHELVARLAEAITRRSKKPFRIMEVCGGHTLAIRKHAIQQLVPEHIELLSGPGCPVCVTDRMSIDRAIALSRLKGIIIATYGDLIRVPGSKSSLNQERAQGADIRIVYSTLDALDIARTNAGKKLIFLGIGFETTTPSSAVAILEAERQGISNFFLLSMHKVMPPAMGALIDQGIRIDGYIGPGHVSAVAGANMYQSLVEKYGIAVAIAGFEPVDLLQSIYMLVCMHEENRHGVEIQYKRVVTPQGNMKAREMVSRVFDACDETWRGLGMIRDSGLQLKKEYSRMDASLQFDIQVEPLPEPAGCICGEVLRGMKKPAECRLFGKTCTPSYPVGACMVSGEGACQAYYQFR